MMNNSLSFFCFKNPLTRPDFDQLECLSTPYQFYSAKLCTSDCSRSGLVGGIFRITGHGSAAVTNVCVCVCVFVCVCVRAGRHVHLHPQEMLVAIQ